MMERMLMVIILKKILRGGTRKVGDQKGEAKPPRVKVSCV